MSYVDIAIIVIVALGAIIGLWKGFFKTIISFFGWLISFLIAFFLTKVVSQALLEVGAIQNKILGESSSLFTWVSGILPEGIASGEGIWGTILSPLVALANASGASVETGVTLLITNGIFSIIVCIGLFIAIRIVMMLFTMLANALTANRVIGAINRLFGFIIGGAKGFGFICIVFVIMSFFVSMNFMTPIRNEIEKSVIGGPVSSKVYELTNKFIGADGDLLDRLLEMAGIEKEGEAVSAKDELKKAIPNAVYGAEGKESFNEKYGALEEFKQVSDKLIAYFDAAEVKLAGEIAATDEQLKTFTALFTGVGNVKGAALAGLESYRACMDEYKTSLDKGENEKLAEIKTAAFAKIAEVTAAINGCAGFTDLFGVPDFLPAPAL